jgi:hypothetical protein
MATWFTDFHHVLLLRLLSLGFVFGVLWPSVGFLAMAGSRLTMRCAERVIPKARIPWGQT